MQNKYTIILIQWGSSPSLQIFSPVDAYLPILIQVTPLLIFILVIHVPSLSNNLLEALSFQYLETSNYHHTNH